MRVCKFGGAATRCTTRLYGGRGTRFLSRERKLCKESFLAMLAGGAIFFESASLVWVQQRARLKYAIEAKRPGSMQA